MARLIESLIRLRWRVFAGKHSYATSITRFLRRHPGASTKQIVNHLFGAFRADAHAIDAARDYVESELDTLNHFGVVEYREGWYLSTCENPFAELTATLNECDLMDALSDLSTSYVGTCDRRLAEELAKFVADDLHDEVGRQHLYLCFLDVLGAKWPDDTVDLRLQFDLDWSKLNAFLPPELRGSRSVRTLT